ncbi:MAG: alpha/beta hydrolase [Nitratireductor sp.]
MTILKIFAVALVMLVVGLWVTTLVISRRIEAQFPPIGKFVTVNGSRLHYVEVEPGADADLPVLLFLHGASGNARELMGAFAEPLKGRARMIFVDRPGAGYSDRGKDADRMPETQADYFSGLLRQLGIEKAIIVGHSLGGGMAAAFALRHPGQVAGLVFIAAATHPWPGGDIDWTYDVANIPVVGWLFAHLVVAPAGSLKYTGALRHVFTPDKVPADYASLSGTRLVLRPANFLANARDVGSFWESTKRLSPLYPSITAPTVIISGDGDEIVLEHVHSDGLNRDIKGSRLIWLKGAGHMPTYTRTGEIIAEIERLANEIRNGGR